MKSLNEILRSIRPVDSELEPVAWKRLDSLTKPRRSLGRLENIAARLVCIHGSDDSPIRRKVIFTFAGDHGIAAEGVSLYPSTVTSQMLRNFISGGAAVNVLARTAGAENCVVDAGVLSPLADIPAGRLYERRIGPGTRNFFHEDAMTPADAVRSMETGADVFRTENDRLRIDLAGVGEMGIANTTSASAIICSLLGIPAAQIVGRGTGLDDRAWERKREVVIEGMRRRGLPSADPLVVMAKVGGFEIGEMAGCFLAGASARTPMLVDGFISTAAAVIATRLCPAVSDYLFYSHASAEGGYRKVIEALGVEPILNLDMRLGEGTGTALAMNVLESAWAIYHEMASFDSAGVDTPVPPPA